MSIQFLISNKNANTLRRSLDIAYDIASVCHMIIHADTNILQVKTLDTYNVSELNINININMLSKNALQPAAKRARITNNNDTVIVIRISELVKSLKSILIAKKKKIAIKMVLKHKETLRILDANIDDATLATLHHTKCHITNSNQQLVLLGDDAYTTVSFLSTDLIVMLLNAALCSTFVYVSLVNNIFELCTNFELGQVNIKKKLTGEYDIDFTSTVSLKFLKTIAITAMFSDTAYLLFPHQNNKPMIFSTNLNGQTLQLSFIDQSPFETITADQVHIPIT